MPKTPGNLEKGKDNLVFETGLAPLSQMIECLEGRSALPAQGGPNAIATMEIKHDLGTKMFGIFDDEDGSFSFPSNLSETV